MALPRAQTRVETRIHRSVGVRSGDGILLLARVPSLPCLSTAPDSHLMQRSMPRSMFHRVGQNIELLLHRLPKGNCCARQSPGFPTPCPRALECQNLPTAMGPELLWHGGKATGG